MCVERSSDLTARGEKFKPFYIGEKEHVSFLILNLQVQISYSVMSKVISAKYTLAANEHLSEK